MRKQAWIALLLIGGCATGTDTDTESSELATRVGDPPTKKVCSNIGCDNKDPTLTLNSAEVACSADATTAVGGSMSADGGLLELRWGPNCNVNWARFIPGVTGVTYHIWASRQSPVPVNTDEYEFSSTANLSEFSNEVYAPSPVKARACVEQQAGSLWIKQVCTPWI